MPTPIYRITHYQNLDFILRSGIYCRNAEQHDPNVYNIGDSSLISSRGNKTVPISPGGVLNDYVPFYFGVHSPMLLRIHTNRVQGVNCSQRDVIYLYSTIAEIEKNKLSYIFTDGHAYQGYSNYFSAKSDLKKLDFATINAKRWADTPNDNDRMRRKQAEFLVYKFVPTQCILGVGTYDDHTLAEVKSILSQNNSNIPAKVKNSWYY